LHEFRDFVVAGGLMSYGTSGRDEYREKPADLPIMQPTKFELVINLKTAKSLGINVPISMIFCPAIFDRRVLALDIAGFR
jgi:putative ABC transport system substrate-binding protein